MDLRVEGDYSFDGLADFTIGVKFSRGGIIRTIRQVMFPPTIGIDLLANSIQVSVKGKWPDLRQSTGVNTLQWMDELFDPNMRFDPDKYSLKKAWEN